MFCVLKNYCIFATEPAMVLAILRVGGPEQYVSQKWRGKPLHLFYITFSILKPLYSQTLLIVLVKDFCCLKFCTLSLTLLLCAVAAAKGTRAPCHSFRGRGFDDFAFFVATKGTTGPYYSFRRKEMRCSGGGERWGGVLCFEKVLYICKERIGYSPSGGPDHASPRFRPGCCNLEVVSFLLVCIIV
jgi:hypothetical protein